MGSKYVVKMFSFNFGKKEIATKDFYKQIQVSNILTINVNKVVLSDKVPNKNDENQRYILGYEVDGETIIPLFIKTPKNIFSYSLS